MQLIMTGLAVRVATVADAAALVALINSAYRGDSSKAGWTTEADLVGGQRVDVEGLRRESDLLVGADGVNSRVRALYEDAIRPSIDTRRSGYRCQMR
jgi:hypothetical protein